MLTVVVPPEHQSGLRELAALEDHAFDGLVSFLGEAQPAASTNFLVGPASDKTGLDPTIVAAILDVLLAFSSQMRERGLKPEEFLSLVAPAIDRFTSVLGLDSDAVGRRAGILLRAAGPAIELTAKAIELAHTHAYPMGSARAITDVRPVFSDDNPPHTYGSLLVHTLLIRCKGAEGESNNVFITLDEHDLADLLRVLGRAEEKGRRLRDELRDTRLAILRTRSEDQ